MESAQGADVWLRKRLPALVPKEPVTRNEEDIIWGWVENHQVEPSLATLEKLSKALGVSVCDFISEREDVEHLLSSLNSDVLFMLCDLRVQAVLRAIRNFDSGELKFVLDFIQLFKTNHKLLNQNDNKKEVAS